MPVEASESLPATCIICGPLGGVDFVLNIFLFIPIGVAIVMLGGRTRHAVIVGLLLTLAIEGLQLFIIPGRHASLGDLLANTLGSAFGSWLATHALLWLRATGNHALRLSAASALLASGIMVSSAALLLPAIPGWPLYVQWTPVTPNTTPFPGKLVSAEVNGRPLKAMEWLQLGWNPDSVSTQFSVRTIVEGPASTTSRRATILRVAHPGLEALMLAQLGDGVLFRSHALASQLRLRTPVVALNSVFPAAKSGRSDGAIMIEAVSNPRAITVRSQQGDDSELLTVRRSVGLGWVLLAPRDFALNEASWLVNALWLGMLVTPVSFFTRRSGSSNRGMARSIARWMPPGLVLLGLTAATTLTGLSAPGPGECLGLVAGAAAGWWTERFVAAGHLTNLSDTTIELIEE
jgi:hypothetical protein